MGTQSITLIGSYDGSKKMRLPADTTLEQLVREFGISRIRIPSVSYDELAEGEKAVELQTCYGCRREVLTTNMNDLCPDCEKRAQRFIDIDNAIKAMEEEQKDIEQRFCQKCGGMTDLQVKGQNIPPRAWTHYGFAGDIGCICQ